MSCNVMSCNVRCHVSCVICCVMCRASCNLMYVCLFLSVWLAICVSGCLSGWLSVYPSARPSVPPSVCLFECVLSFVCVSGEHTTYWLPNKQVGKWIVSRVTLKMRQQIWTFKRSFPRLHCLAFTSMKKVECFTSSSWNQLIPGSRQYDPKCKSIQRSWLLRSIIQKYQWWNRKYNLLLTKHIQDIKTCLLPGSCPNNCWSWRRHVAQNDLPKKMDGSK